MPGLKSPSYLIRNRYSYCFRQAVPKDLQRIIGKKELRRSLKTGYLSEAKEKARLYAAHVQSLFRYLRKAGLMAQLTEDQIRHLVSEYLSNGIKRLEEVWYDEDFEPPDDPRQYCEDMSQIRYGWSLYSVRVTTIGFSKTELLIC